METWFLTPRDEYGLTSVESWACRIILNDNLLKEHRKYYLCMLVNFTLHKLLGLLFHYLKGSEFVRECKMYKDLVLEPDQRVFFERFWRKLKKNINIYHKGKRDRSTNGLMNTTKLTGAFRDYATAHRSVTGPCTVWSKYTTWKYILLFYKYKIVIKFVRSGVLKHFPCELLSSIQQF
jgi:hypothetical protein